MIIECPECKGTGEALDCCPGAIEDCGRCRGTGQLQMVYVVTEERWYPDEFERVLGIYAKEFDADKRATDEREWVGKYNEDAVNDLGQIHSVIDYEEYEVK